MPRSPAELRTELGPGYGYGNTEIRSEAKSTVQSSRKLSVGLRSDKKHTLAPGSRAQFHGRSK